MPRFLVENVKRYCLHSVKVRIWSEKALPDQELVEWSFKDCTTEDAYLAMAKQLLETRQANAIEVLSRDEGFVVYRDWP